MLEADGVSPFLPLPEMRKRGITVLMVTHEPDMAAYARRTIRFVDGRIESDLVQAQAPGQPEPA